MSLKLTLSPAFSLTRDGEPILLKNKKAQALLVYLALTGQPQSREHLATLLWGDRFDDQARNSLRQALFALRKAVGEGVVTGDDPLVLATGMVTADAADLLPGFSSGAEDFDNWLSDEQERNRTARVSALVNEIEAEKTAGDLVRALELAETARTLSPFDESLARLTMNLLAGEGRRAEALTLFDTLKATLAGELDAKPDIATTHLAQMIRQGEGTEHAIARTSAPKPTHLDASIGPIRDLGGGETATYLSAELPGSLMRIFSSMGWMNTASQLLDPDITELPALIDAARQQDSRTVSTGTVRQIGPKVRIAVNTYETTDGSAVMTYSKTIDESEAFDFLDSDPAEFRSLWRDFYLKSGPKGLQAIAELEKLTDQPDRFLSALQDVAMQAFFTFHDKPHFEEFDEICDYALTVFPRDENVLTFKGWARFYAVQLGHDKNRQDGFREAYEYLRRALALKPGHAFAVQGRLMVGVWLAEFEEAEQSFDALISATHGISGISGHVGQWLPVPGSRCRSRKAV